MADIDTADMRALAIVEENAKVLYRMVTQATGGIDRLRARLAEVEAVCAGGPVEPSFPVFCLDSFDAGVDATMALIEAAISGEADQPAEHTCDRCPAWKACEHELSGKGDRG